LLTLEKEKKNQALINNKYIPVNSLVEKFGEEFHSKGLHISKHTFAFPEKFLHQVMYLEGATFNQSWHALYITTI